MQTEKRTNAYQFAHSRHKVPRYKASGYKVPRYKVSRYKASLKKRYDALSDISDVSAMV